MGARGTVWIFVCRAIHFPILDSGGLLGDLKKALAERMLNGKLDLHWNNQGKPTPATIVTAAARRPSASSFSEPEKAVESGPSLIINETGSAKCLKGQELPVSSMMRFDSGIAAAHQYITLLCVLAAKVVRGCHLLQRVAMQGTQRPEVNFSIDPAPVRSVTVATVSPSAR